MKNPSLDNSDELKNRSSDRETRGTRLAGTPGASICLLLRIACAARLLPLLLLVTLPAAVQAQYEYTTVNDTITITGYNCFGGAEITIPSTIDGLPVTSIGDGAFSGCDSLTSVTIPNSVTSIGNRAFYLCTSLSAITVEALNSVYSSVDGVVFNKSQTTLIQYPGGKVGSYTIPNSVTIIRNDAFSGCTSLTSVTIPNSVTSIEYGAFSGCTSLTSVTIPNSVTRIGDYALLGCDSLTSVTIPNSVTSIGDRAFSGSAITVEVLNSVYSSSDGVLFNKSQTTLIQYPGGKVGSYTIPNSVTRIGYWAFSGCSSLTSVTIPNSVTSIGHGAFSDCTSLTSVTIPNGVTSIGHGAFSSCTGLTSVTIPNSVTSIEYGAFSGCTSLTSVTIPNSVTSIEYRAFSGCSGLTNVTIPNSVTTIWSSTFQGCTSLTSITIPNSVTSIGYGAFSACTSLTSITIPNSVTNIGSAAFAYCNSLTGVYFMGNAPNASDFDVFNGAGGAIVYYFPGTTGWAPTFGGRLTRLWSPQIQTGDASFGVRANQFGFSIHWASDRVVVVEAATDLANPVWFPVGTNTLTGGSSYFSDPDWRDHPGRFYRLRLP